MSASSENGVCPQPSPYDGCPSYEEHGACPCSTGYPMACQVPVDQEYVSVRREVLAHLVRVEQRLSAASGCALLTEAREVLSGGQP